MKTVFLALILVCLAVPKAFAADCGEERLLRHPGRQRMRAEFISAYAKRVFASKATNQKYIDLVKSGARRVHWVMDVALLKVLNRDLNNKDFATALVNFHKELLLAEISARMPELRFDFYSDFKSIRLAIEGPLDDIAYAKLEEAYLAANAKFYASEIVGQIVRTEDLKKPWFALGVSRDGVADSAALAARVARKFGANQIAYFEDPQVQESLAKKVTAVKTQHMQLLNRLRTFGLVEGAELKLDVFAEARKNKTPEALSAALRQISGMEMDAELAGLVLKYMDNADEFSPNMLIAEREHLSIEDAPFGAMSLDFIGLGAENIQATAKALVEADDVSDAIRRARMEEARVTARFEARKESVKQAALKFFDGKVSIRFSGDDGIIIPGEEFLLRRQMQFMQVLALLSPKPFFRMAIIGADGAASAASSELVTHSESIEKKMRCLMLIRLGPSLSSEIHFEVMTPDQGLERKVFLVIGSNRRLNYQEAANVKSIFDDAVKAVESDVRAIGEKVSYEPFGVFSLMGRDRLPAAGGI